MKVLYMNVRSNVIYTLLNLTKNAEKNATPTVDPLVGSESEAL